MYAHLLFVVVGIFGAVLEAFRNPIWPYHHDQVATSGNTRRIARLSD
jgi:hypothetical protein